VSEVNTAASNVSVPTPASGPRRFTLWQRFTLSIIVFVGYWFVRLIGSTLRVCVSREEGAQETLDRRPTVASFWHACIIPATYAFRGFGIRVMSSFSYDGEYMGRIIRKFGFVPVKGSSSRSPIRALLGLRRALEEGWTVAFSIDGPRGPRYQVKPGPVALARSTGAPLTMFHMAVERAWVLNTWDRLIIPMPFSRVLLRIGKLIAVPPDIPDADLDRFTDQLQQSLERVCEFAEKHVKQVGTPEFPLQS